MLRDNGIIEFIGRGHYRKINWFTEVHMKIWLGDYAYDGGDAIKLLDYLAEWETFYPVEIHTANPIGRENMYRMLDRYWPDLY